MKIVEVHQRNGATETRYCNNCGKIAQGEYHRNPLARVAGCSCSRPDFTTQTEMTLKGTPEEMEKVYDVIKASRQREPI